MRGVSAKKLEGWQRGLRAQAWPAVAAAACWIWLAALQPLPAAAQSPAGASEGHVALLIGAGRFEGAFASRQSTADVAALESRLRTRGFKLIGVADDGQCADGRSVIDPGRDTLLKALDCLAAAARGARQVVLYFSGHSVRVGNDNFLVPAATSLAGLPPRDQLIELKSAIEKLEQAKPGLTVVILDAARPAMRAVAAATPGLARAPASQTARIVAYSAPVGAWTSVPRSDAEPSPTSPYTQRLVRALDEDMDQRSLGEPGLEPAAILIRAAEPTQRGAASGELLIENVVSADMLGRPPVVGKSMCEILGWRAAHLGHCLEIATAYEACGRNFGLRDQLQKQCPSDWGAILRAQLRQSLGTTMSGVQKGSKCSGLRQVVARFEGESAMAALPEFAEIRSLAQYTCAIELAETRKVEFAAVQNSRSCPMAQDFLAKHGKAVEGDMRGQLDKLIKEVCCPEVGLGKDCLTRRVAMTRVVTKLEEKGCSMGSGTDAKLARATHVLGQINTEAGLGIDMAANGILLDKVFARLDTLKKEDCTCRSNEALSRSGACACQGFGASDPVRCLDREAAVRSVQERLTALGCDIGQPDGKLGDKTTRYIARLRHIDSAVTERELTAASFAAIDKMLSAKANPDGRRICADLVIEDGLSREQRRAVDARLGEVQDRPYAALAVASTCPATGSCDWASGLGPDPDSARQKAIDACQQKAKSCLLAASHRQRGASDSLPAPARSPPPAAPARPTEAGPPPAPEPPVPKSPAPAKAPDRKADAPAEDRATLVLGIQQNLQRVGCSPGGADGTWGPKAKSAASQFIRRAGVKIDVDEPSQALLDALAARTARVCPLDCGVTEFEKDGQCVRKSCPSGQKLDSDGDCEPIAKAAAPTPPRPKDVAPPRQTQAAASSGGGGGCGAWRACMRQNRQDNGGGWVGRSIGSQRCGARPDGC